LSQGKDTYLAGDHGELTRNPNHFYDFTDKVAHFVVKASNRFGGPTKMLNSYVTCGCLWATGEFLRPK